VKVLITGGSGQVGHALQQTAPEAIELLTPSRQELDLAQTSDIEKKLPLLAPDAVINAAAFTAVDKAENAPELAQRINADAVGEIAAYCQRLDIPLIHISTDFVFNGQQSVPYKPEDQPDPLGTYGKTKYAGEIAALKAYPNTYIVRSSWIYSTHGQNFVKTMLRMANDQKPIHVVDDQIGTPTYANDLAQALWTILAALPANNILHFSNTRETSWYQFAVEIFAEARRTGLLESAPEVGPIPSTAYPLPAKRPAYSALDCSETFAIPGIMQNDWRTALHAMLARLSND
jgi:dTDP-4-dehydrorhamnose reductase